VVQKAVKKKPRSHEGHAERGGEKTKKPSKRGKHVKKGEKAGEETRKVGVPGRPKIFSVIELFR
jgi:hypothetical protein